jgi:predicted Fe-S protein YdhL (DUF1289 family)
LHRPAGPVFFRNPIGPVPNPAPPTEIPEGSKRMTAKATPTPVRAPCVKVCQMDPTNGLCLGCSRTQDERDWWVAYSEEQKSEVLRRCDQRKEVLASGTGEFAPSMGIVESRRKTGH